MANTENDSIRLTITGLDGELELFDEPGEFTSVRMRSYDEKKPHLEYRLNTKDLSALVGFLSSVLPS